MARGIMQYDENYRLLAAYQYDSRGNDIIFQELIKNDGINYQIPSRNPFRPNNDILFGCTALHITIKKNDLKNFKLLIENGADYTIKDGNNETPIHIIVRKLHSNPKDSVNLGEFLDSILSAQTKAKNHSNPKDDNGISHFHAACIRSRTKLVKLFLKNGVSPNEVVDIESKVFPGYTAMHFAAHFSCFSTVKLLLNRGANINCKDARAWTPLDIIIKRNMEIADWVNMGKRDSYDNLKEQYERNEKIIEMILNKISLDDRQDNLQLSNLHVACVLKDTSKLEIELRKEKVLVNQCVSKTSSLWAGFTPLHFAACFNTKSVKILLNNGAKLLTKNAKGLTPFDLCLQRYEVQDICSFLELIPKWKNITFANTGIKLSSSLSAMKNEKTFDKFLKSRDNINMCIESTSPIFPGYTLLHVLVTLSERYQDIKNIEKQSFYEETVGRQFNCRKEQEELYVRRIQMCLNSSANVAVTNSNSSTPLHLAFKLHKESAVNLLLEYYEDKVDFVNEDNLSHLDVACAAGRMTVVEKLLSTSIDNVNRVVTRACKYHTSFNEKRIDFEIFSGSTPLHMAVLSRNAELVKLLIDHNADVYAKDSKGLTPLHQIFIQQSKDKVDDRSFDDIASALLASNDLKECLTNFGLSHLHIASYANNVIAIENLLSNGANIDAAISLKKSSFLRELQFSKDLDRFTPLHLALKHNCREAVIALIRYDAEILTMPPEIIQEIRRTKQYYIALTLINEMMTRQTFKNLNLTPLHAACATLDIERVRELLNRGADPNAQVHKDSPLCPGDTALHFVVIKREYYAMNLIGDIIDLMLNHGADVTLMNLTNNTVIHRASLLHLLTSGVFQFPEQFFGAHTDFNVNPTNDEGVSHFHVACLLNQVNVVEQFLKHGTVNINQPTDFASTICAGNTPLHLAARNKFAEIVDLLLNHGANIYSKNLLHRFPIHEAADFNRNPDNLSEQAIVRLAKTGMKLHSRTLTTKTPLETLLLTKRSTTDTFKLFLKEKNRVNIFNPHFGTGFIAMSISNDMNIEELMQNTFFATVIEVPKANGPDLNGRTPIHNIVSFSSRGNGESAPADVYVKAVELLMRVGFDIDHKDINGLTALHAAVKYRNVDGFTALLNLGADINITDNYDLTPLFYSSMWLKNQHSKITETQKELLKVSLHLIEKIQQTGIYISKLNLTYESRFREYLELSETSEEFWEVEKNKMLMEEIDSSNCKLWNFVCETGIVSSYPKMIPSKRETIDNYFQKNACRLSQEYPHFGGLLMLQYRKAKARVDLIKVARTSLCNSLNGRLPEICCDLILEYLSNHDLKKMIVK